MALSNPVILATVVAGGQTDLFGKLLREVAMIVEAHIVSDLGNGGIRLAQCLARGMEAVNFRIVLQIMLYWVLTVPAAAITSMLLFWIIRLFY